MRLTNSAAPAPATSSIGETRAKLRTPVGYRASSSPFSANGSRRVSPMYEFVGETIARGPSGAWLRNGISLSAQPELNVPTTPITLAPAA